MFRVGKKETIRKGAKSAKEQMKKKICCESLRFTIHKEHKEHKEREGRALVVSQEFQ
jgi:hypothetical protein